MRAFSIFQMHLPAEQEKLAAERELQERAKVQLDKIQAELAMLLDYVFAPFDGYGGLTLKRDPRRLVKDNLCYAEARVDGTEILWSPGPLGETQINKQDQRRSTAETFEEAFGVAMATCLAILS